MPSSPPQRHGRARTLRASVVALLATLTLLPACAVFRTVSEGLLFGGHGQAVELRERDARSAPRTGPRPTLLLLAIDGADRDLLYDLLRSGEMPELAALVGLPLGRRPGEVSRAHLEPSLVAALPSSTAVAWATAMTGEAPAVHGIVGNEFFLREERHLVAPVPASVEDPSDVLATYTDELVNELLLAPTIYERMREREPGLSIWVAMHQVFRGADVLLLPDRVAILDAFRVILQEKVRAQIDDEDASRVSQELDGDVVASVRKRLQEETPPDVLTVYLPGTDLYAHVARTGPDAARRDYLARVVDPLVGELASDLRARGALRDRWVVLTSDHGHTELVHGHHYSLGVEEEGDPGQVLRRAGFRLRPFQLGASEDSGDFDAVLAYQGALAYVYLADRSDCLERGTECDWTRPPRLEEDVLEAADAFYRTSTEGLHASQMVDSLEMVLVRKRADGGGAPFEVYVGGGRLEPVARHLAAHPRPNWPYFEKRLRALADGPAADRVGDIVLIARAGDEWPLGKRRYFAPPYRSHHGSPAKKDSQIPFVVGHPTHPVAETRRRVTLGLAGSTDQSRVAHVLLELLYGEVAGDGLRGEAPTPAAIAPP
jgi:hypothetical protein